MSSISCRDPRASAAMLPTIQTVTILDLGRLDYRLRDAVGKVLDQVVCRRVGSRSPGQSYGRRSRRPTL